MSARIQRLANRIVDNGFEDAEVISIRGLKSKRSKSLLYANIADILNRRSADSLFIRETLDKVRRANLLDLLTVLGETLFDPAEEDNALLLAEIYFATGEYGRALDVVLPFIAGEERDTTVPLLRMAAKSFSKLRRWQESLDVWLRLRMVEPSRLENHVGVLRMLVNMGRRDEAFEACETAINSIPRDDFYARTLARLAEALDFTTVAENLYKESVALSGRSASSILALSRFYLRKGYYASAYRNLLVLENPVYGNNASKRSALDALRKLRRLGEALQVDIETEPPERHVVAALASLLARRKDNGVARSRSGSSLRVLIATSTLGAGGAERQVMVVAHALQSYSKRDISASVAVLNSRGNPSSTFFQKTLESDGVAVYVSPSGDRHARLSDLDEDVCTVLSYFPEALSANIAHLLDLIEQVEPDVIVGWQDVAAVAAGMAAKLGNVPRVVLTSRSVNPTRKRGRNAPYLRDSFLALLASDDVTLVNNSAAGASDYAEWLRVGPRSVGVIPNILDRVFVDAVPRRPYTANTERAARRPPVVGTVIRFSEEKRPRLWLDIARELLRLRDVRFVMVGDGPLLELSKREVDELNMSGRFTFPGRQIDITSWYSKMDVFLLTSRIEGLPNVLIEAQAMGLPVVSSNAGGAAETFVDGKTGWLVEANDTGSYVDALCRAIDAVDTDPSIRSSCREHAVTAFSSLGIVEEWVDVVCSTPGTTGAA